MRPLGRRLADGGVSAGFLRRLQMSPITNVDDQLRLFKSCTEQAEKSAAEIGRAADALLDVHGCDGNGLLELMAMVKKYEAAQLGLCFELHRYANALWVFTKQGDNEPL